MVGPIVGEIHDRTIILAGKRRHHQLGSPTEDCSVKQRPCEGNDCAVKRQVAQAQMRDNPPEWQLPKVAFGAEPRTYALQFSPAEPTITSA